MAITNYSELQTAIANWLNRDDLTTRIPEFIALGEGTLRRDRRVHRLQNNDSFTVSAEVVALPSDFARPEALYHNGPTYFGPIEIVSADKLGQLRADQPETTTGVPQFAAVVGGNLRFAPPPNATFTLRFVYWGFTARLSDASPTNSLLTDFPDIYLYASLVESAPFLKDDARIAVWQSQLEKRLNELEMFRESQQYGGTLRMRPRQAIG